MVEDLHFQISLPQVQHNRALLELRKLLNCFRLFWLISRNCCCSFTWWCTSFASSELVAVVSVFFFYWSCSSSTVETAWGLACVSSSQLESLPEELPLQLHCLFRLFALSETVEVFVDGATSSRGSNCLCNFWTCCYFFCTCSFYRFWSFCNRLRKVCNLNSLIINRHLIGCQICCRSCHFFTRVCFEVFGSTSVTSSASLTVVVKTVSGKIKSILVILFKFARTVTSTPKAFCNGAQGITILNGITCFVVRFSQIILNLLNTTCSPKNFFCLSCQYWGKWQGYCWRLIIFFLHSFKFLSNEYLSMITQKCRKKSPLGPI